MTRREILERLIELPDDELDADVGDIDPITLERPATGRLVLALRWLVGFVEGLRLPLHRLDVAVMAEARAVLAEAEGQSQPNPLPLIEYPRGDSIMRLPHDG